MTMLRTGIDSFLSAAASLQLSDAAMMVGMVTTTNSVVFSLRNTSRASAMRSLSSSSLTTAGSLSFCLPVKKLVTAPVTSVSFWRRRTSLPIDTSRKSGRDSRRSVWPVGAVSKMMRLYWANSGFFKNWTTLDSATASSTPGGGVSSSSPSCRSLSCSATPPRPTPSSTSFSFLPPSSCMTCLNSARASSGSISMPHRGISPMGEVMRTGLPPVKSWSNESLSECAGSVDTTRVGRPSDANLTARLAAQLVLPTPPLPPKR
mmetsp:Transcript_10733/g.23071  ORF Transcript_10733/g.23071 Transcript_10733/m.23071 type:complete len:261 (-) Transcript_10733:1388-2170(-)